MVFSGDFAGFAMNDGSSPPIFVMLIQGTCIANPGHHHGRNFFGKVARPEVLDTTFLHKASVMLCFNFKQQIVGCSARPAIAMS